MELDDRSFALFLEVYGTLPRAGPGGDEYTLRALDLVAGPSPTSILDLGCGPGGQTLALGAALPGARIIAVDVLPAMVEEARRRFADAGFGDRVVAVEGDMAAPPVRPASQDLIWCEGAIYNVGVTEALSRWSSLVAPGGSVVFTEPVWLVESPPTEVVEWWAAEYPAISDRTGVQARIDAASWRTTGSFTLPASAWWDEYYAPMQDRIAGLRSRLPDDPVAQQVVAAAEREIDAFRRFSECYSYEFFVVRPAR